MATSISVLLLTGLAQLLDDAAVATYRPEGEYADDETPITFGELVPVGPAIALSLYAAEIVDRSSTRYLVQVRIRSTADPLELELVDGVANALSWRRHPPMPAGVDVVQIRPTSRAQLGKIAGAYQHTLNLSLLT